MLLNFESVYFISSYPCALCNSGSAPETALLCNLYRGLDGAKKLICKVFGDAGGVLFEFYANHGHKHHVHFLINDFNMNRPYFTALLPFLRDGGGVQINFRFYIED